MYTSIVRPILTKASTAWHSPTGTPFARKWPLKKLSPLQNSCLRAISGAFRATPIRNLEAEVGVPPLGIYLDSLQARFRLRLEESEVQEVIREAVESMRQTLGGLEGERSRGRRPRRRNQRASRDGDEGEGMGGMGEGDRNGQDEQEEEQRRRNATQGPPLQQPPINHQNRLSWAHAWLPPNNPRRPTTLQTRAKLRLQQAWLQQWQASAPHPANPTSIEAPPGTDVLVLHQHLRKPESSLAVQLRTGKNGFNAFLYQARVPTVPSPLCSCGRGSQTAKHILIHCSTFAAARHQLRDDQGRLPDYKQLLTTPEGLQKVTRWVIQRGILGQYRRARGFLYPPGPSSP